MSAKYLTVVDYKNSPWYFLRRGMSKEMVTDNENLLERFITDNELWVFGYDSRNKTTVTFLVKRCLISSAR